MKTYVFHSDSEHGWLAVKRSELDALGVIDKITPYSYTKGGTVYLEEDCDASAFFDAYVAKYHTKPVTRSSKQRDRSPIRGFTSFRK